MYAACFCISGWAGPEYYIFAGSKLKKIVDSLIEVQDLNCLIEMGKMMGPKKDQKELNKLSLFIDKYTNNKLQEDDIANFNISLSTGDLRCLELLQAENAKQILKDKYPNAAVK